MPALRGCLSHCNVKFFLCVKMCPSTQDLHQTRGVHTLTAPLLFYIVPFCSYHTHVLLQCFYKWSGLHHVAAFICSETLPTALTQGRGTLRSSSGPSGYNTLLPSAMHEGRHCREKQLLNEIWREMWLSHSVCLKLATPSLDSRSNTWCGCALVLGLSQAKLSRLCGVLCKTVSPRSEHIWKAQA